MNKKPKSKKRVYLQERDTEVMRTLARYGLLRLSTLHALCFSSLKHQENVQKKLKRLIDNKYIFRKFPEIRRRSLDDTADKKQDLFEKHRREQVFCLDKRGAEEIGLEKFDSRFRKMLGPDKNTPHHRLDIADVRACFELAVEADNDIGLAVWWDEYEKNEDDEYVIRMERKNGIQIVDPDSGKERTLPLCPDGCFVLQDLQSGKRDLFFLEVDEGTESGKKRWYDKILAYRAFGQRGFKQHFPQFAKNGFRVLTVNRSETGKQQLKRTQGLIEATHNARGAKRFWFCPFEGVMPEECASADYILDAPVWFRVKLDELADLAQKGHGLRLADFLFDRDREPRP